MLTQLQRIKGVLADLPTATEPDRELDVLIAVAIDWKGADHEEGDDTVRSLADRDGMTRMVARATQHNSIWRHIPAFTASYDAAMSIAGDQTGRRFEFGTIQEGNCWAYAHLEAGQGGDPDVVGEAEACANEPIALCVAILQAHVARLEAFEQEMPW